MRDRDVRIVLRRHLADLHAGESDTILVEELEVVEARVDMAVVNGELNGFEIKSDRDTLTRLPRQRDCYNQVFERVTIVVGIAHSDEVDSLIPDWWGVIIATMMDDQVTLLERRPAERNPHLTPLALVNLLWRSELLEALSGLSLLRGFKSKPNRVLAKRLSEAVEVTELSSIVRRSLKSRKDWRADWL